MHTPLQIAVLSADIAARATLIGLPAALLAAIVLASARRGRSIVDVIVNLPLMLPPVVVGWLLLLLFGVQGPIGAQLARLGIRLVFTAWGAAFASAVMAIPLMVRPLLVTLEGIDGALLETAATLGAGRLDRFATVVMPLALPGVLTSALLGFTASLGEFGAVITFAASVPGQTQTLSLATYAALQLPDGDAVAAKLAAISIAMAATLLVAISALQRRLLARHY